MRKKYKKLTACAVAVMLGLSHMVYPVHAEEVQSSEQTDTGGLLEVDETAVPMEESTEPEATPTPEVGEMVTAPEEDKEEFTSESVKTEQEVDEPESVTQEQTENEADKEEPTSESVEMEQETQPEATEQTKVEAEPQEQTEVQENAVLLADTNTFNINENSVNITQGGTYTINGTGQATSNTISVTGSNISATITLNNVNIDVSNKRKKAFLAKDYDQSNVGLTIILQGTNSLKSGTNCAGLTWNNKDDNSTLKIQGDGSLTATGISGGAGIGAGWQGFSSENNDTKNITINGGFVTATGTGADSGAGIGGGRKGSGENIIINGGFVIATGGDQAAGIGGSVGYSGKNITINGGTVTATSSSGGAGIGGGCWSSGENITINGGIVTATGSGHGASIGGGEGGDGKAKNITINGGTVTATGENSGAGIGGSSDGGTGENIIITGGSVKTSRISTTPTDGNGHNVYLAKLDNQSGVNQVTVDSGKTFIRAGNHPDGDTAFYLYLTGENHTVTANDKTYNVKWDNAHLKWTLNAPKVEIDNSKTTASSITVKELENKDTYGGAEYKINDREWQDSNVFENLHSSGYGGNNYTVYARYKGNDTYATSEPGSTTSVSTNAANYTITIPAEPVEAGNSESKAELKPSDSFDLGFGGTATVKIKENSGVDNGGKLTLTRQGDTGKHTITSALLVDNTALEDINKSVATFKAKNDSPVTVSFAKPTETNIPAGTYNGTITFVVSYSEQ